MYTSKGTHGVEWTGVRMLSRLLRVRAHVNIHQPKQVSHRDANVPNRDHVKNEVIVNRWPLLQTGWIAYVGKLGDEMV